VMFGVISLLWLLPWMAVKRPARADVAPQAAPSFLAIGRQRALWGACIGHFAGNFALYFMFSWLPLYLVKTRGFSVPQMAQFAGLLYLGYALSALVSGWTADRWIASGASLNTVRKATITAGHAGVALCLVLCAVGSPTLSLTALFVSGLMFGIITPALYAIGQTLAGPAAAGKWAGLQNCVANTAGIVGPIVTGMIVDATGQFTWAFVLVGAITLVGAAGWALVIPRVAPIAWNA
jgi:MFS family permease